MSAAWDAMQQPAILPCFPLGQSGFNDKNAPIIIEIKVGSSEGGAGETPLRTTQNGLP